ncbi:MAG: hypothetical protein K6G33_03440 [Ruminococcus sp.]|uniref:hypothetical protein n=1 Tax=Ruminococcus sp. TaxID=41978 RepID=UPI0025E6D091|nr:hypothetical protein [Ruminococcus sp.]MCR5599784.1 hypothetical protein [Ruminococcus sp.]
MKKIFGILAAAAMLVSCYSCDDSKNKKNDNENTEIVSDASGEQALDEPVEQEFKEYSADYFRTVNLNVNRTDNKPPFTEYSMNIDDPDFGTRISPCRDEKYIDRYKPDFSSIVDAEYRQQAEDMWENSKTVPVKGVVVSYNAYKNYLYAAVNYDYCIGTEGYHELSIFRVNGDTGEKDEIFRHSDPENGINIDSMYYYNGVLYVVLYNKSICYLDEKKQELVPIKELAADQNVTFLPNSSGRFIIETTVYDKEFVTEDYKPQNAEYVYDDGGGQPYLIKGIEYTLEEYDPNTNEWTALYSAYENEDDEPVSGTAEYPYLKGKYFSWLEKPEGKRKYDVVTENYRVSTGLTSCDIVYVDDSKVMVSQVNINGGGGNNTRLHVYDFVKAEHYIIDTSGFGTLYSVLGDGLIVSSDDRCCYFRPELGLMFKLAEYDGDETLVPYRNTFIENENTVALNTVLKKGDYEEEFNGETYTVNDYENIIHWFVLEE